MAFRLAGPEGSISIEELAAEQGSGGGDGMAAGDGDSEGASDGARISFRVTSLMERTGALRCTLWIPQAFLASRQASVGRLPLKLSPAPPCSAAEPGAPPGGCASR